jgi:hypothetical protein
VRIDASNARLGAAGGKPARKMDVVAVGDWQSRGS